MQNAEIRPIVSQSDMDDIKAVLEDMKSLDGSETVLEMMEELQYHVERIEEILDRKKDGV
jgi:hypothetical protein